MNANFTPSVYVACLAAYNSGILHGEWINLAEVGDISDAILEIMKASPIPDAEEWAVHDHEYCGSLSEYPGIDTLARLTDAYDSCESVSIDWGVFCDYCSHRGEEIASDHLQSFSDSYSGSAESMETWCEQFLEDTGQLHSMPENLRSYFDISRFARDMEMNDVFTIAGDCEVHVFWNH